jgi:hypothetical protein
VWIKTTYCISFLKMHDFFEIIVILHSLVDSSLFLHENSV